MRSKPKLGIAILVILGTCRAEFACADTALLPSATAFVRVRKNAEDFLLSHLKAVAIHGGLTCGLDGIRTPPSLLCSLNETGPNVVSTSTYEEQDLVRVDLFAYGDSLQIDEALQAKLLGMVRQLANDLKRDRHVKAIKECNVPIKIIMQSKMVCEGKSLL
jgi:hypothetical protein